MIVLDSGTYLLVTKKQNRQKVRMKLFGLYFVKVMQGNEMIYFCPTISELVIFVAEQTGDLQDFKFFPSITWS